MHINSIQRYDNYASKNSFGAVIYKPGIKIPTNMKTALKQAETELANTKYWDLVVDNDKLSNLTYYYQKKSHPDTEIYTGPCKKVKFFGGYTCNREYHTGDLYIDLDWGILLEGQQDYSTHCLQLKFLTKEQEDNALKMLENHTEDKLECGKNMVKVLDSACDIYTMFSEHFPQKLVCTNWTLD